MRLPNSYEVRLMGVWLEEEFPDHPKVAAAGDEGGWMYVCGLCYSNRMLTSGTIPTSVVRRLTGFKNPDRLAKRLVEVGLWEQSSPTEFTIHNYATRQQSAERRRGEENEKKRKRSEHAQRAADARWRASGEHPSGIPPSTPGALAEHDVSNAQASRTPPGGLASDPLPSSLGTSSSSNHQSVGDAPAEEEDPSKMLETCRLIAQRRLETRSGPAINDREKWLVSVAVDAERHLGPAILYRISKHPDSTPEELAAMVEPGPKPPPPGPLDATAAAQHERLNREPCATCGGRSGYGVDDSGTAVPCPTCNPEPALRVTT